METYKEKFPLRGTDIEIRKDHQLSKDGDQVFFVHVSQSLLDLMIDKENWSQDEETGRHYLGYCSIEGGYQMYFANKCQ